MRSVTIQCVTTLSNGHQRICFMEFNAEVLKRTQEAAELVDAMFSRVLSTSIAEQLYCEFEDAQENEIADVCN